MRRSWPLAASALALLCLLALTPSGSRAEHAICASITPSHPAWGIYGCGAATGDQQEQVLQGLDEVRSRLDAIENKLDTVGANVQDIELTAQQILSELSAFDLDVVTGSASRILDDDPLESGENVEILVASPGTVLLASCRVILDNNTNQILALRSILDGGGNTTLVQGDGARLDDQIVTVATRIEVANPAVSDADDGFFLVSCNALEIPL